jgi:D-lactate dehydrogenase (cytochrome)
MAACNASGARSFRYGSTRLYVERLRLALADGAAAELARGRDRARGRRFSLLTEDGRRIEGPLPSYSMPKVKNAAGYYAADDMDLVDLIVGSEGTLGVICEMDLRVIPAPAAVWGVMVFLPSEGAAVRFVAGCRAGDGQPAAIEYFDAGALALLRRERETNPAFKEIPAMPEAPAAVYVEYHGPDENAVEAAVLAMSETMTACGGSEDAAQMASDDRTLQRMKDFRHAVPEIVNRLIDERRKSEPGLTKLGTDLAVPDGALADALAMYRAGLAELGLEHVVFGHIGNNHLHVNILPNTLEDYRRARGMYERWAEAVVATGGTVSAEHGIGKLKTALLRKMYGDRGVQEMREVKRLFDPAGALNPGNLFAPAG